MRPARVFGGLTRYLPWKNAAVRETAIGFCSDRLGQRSRLAGSSLHVRRADFHWYRASPEQKRNRHERKERVATLERSQAVLVTAWTDRMGTPFAEDLEQWRLYSTEIMARSQDIGWIVAIRLRNASDAPVYNLQYSLSAGVRGTFVGYVYCLPPGSTMEVLIPLPSPPRASWTTPSIAFIDATAKHWWRTTQGLLIEGAPPQHEFRPDPAAYAGGQHPTLEMPQPARLVDPWAHPRSGRIT